MWRGAMRLCGVLGVLVRGPRCVVRGAYLCSCITYTRIYYVCRDMRMHQLRICVRMHMYAYT